MWALRGFYAGFTWVFTGVLTSSLCMYVRVAAVLPYPNPASSDDECFLSAIPAPPAEKLPRRLGRIYASRRAVWACFDLLAGRAQGHGRVTSHGGPANLSHHWRCTAVRQPAA